ncbi:MAG: metallophosphoesterase, partial [Clostridia bacterium]|nr:metallophosphoesterase [Clostridia bacterium]
WDGTSRAPAEGDGSEGNPYLITDGAELLYSVKNPETDKYYKITNDIYLNDVSDENWKASEENNAWFNINNNSIFNAHLDGDGHVVYGLWYPLENAPYNAGLLKVHSGSVKNLGVANSQIVSSNGISGGLLASSYPTGKVLIENCFVASDVNVSGMYAGGIVGYAQNSSGTAVLEISNCYSAATGVNGGIIGSAYKLYYSIHDCYTVGSQLYGGASSANTLLDGEVVYDNYSDTGSRGTFVANADMLGELAKDSMSGLDFESTFETVKGSTPKLSKFKTYDAGAVKHPTPVFTNVMAVGGDLREGNLQYLKSTQLYSVALFSDLRTQDEILSDLTDTNYSDKALMAYYDMSSGSENILTDRSSNMNDLIYTGLKVVYEKWKRVVEFDKDDYKIVSGQNTFVPTGSEYGENSGVPYFTVISDPEDEDDGMLHFYNHSASSYWYANWNFTPTYNGVSGTTIGQNDYNILPNSTTYKVTARIRINDTDGTTANFTYYYGSGVGAKSFDASTASPLYDLVSGLTETDGFVELEAYFTTPDTYETESSGLVSNRLYMGLYAPYHKLDYDLDYVTIEKVTTANFYVKENGTYTLQETYVGAPGDEINISEKYSAENYSTYDSTGRVTTKLYGNWFADQGCTAPAELKYGNYNLDFYCESVTDIPFVSLKNQEMFVGFDTYTQRTEGLSGAVITNETANSGSMSLKAELTANASAVFEIKNDHELDVVPGKTYKIDFVYKADNAATFGIGLANGVVSNGVDVLGVAYLTQTEDWTAASVTLTADGAIDSSVLAAKLTSNFEATIFVDTIIVSSVTDSVCVESVISNGDDALRFMFAYYGEDENKVLMAGNEYAITEHGVIVKGEELDLALNLENADKDGVFHFAQTDVKNNWNVNPVTGTTIYSAYINGFDANDDYKVSVRGYIKLSNSDVFYTDILTISVKDIPDAVNIIPEDADLTNYYVYLPAGTILPEDADYTVTAFNSAFTAISVVSNNVVTEDAYFCFSSRPDFDKIEVPAESKYLVHAGTKDELYCGITSKVVSEQVSAVGKDSVNYIFITDVHIASSTSQENAIRNQMTLITKMANENDDVDFVVVGGDITNGGFTSKGEYESWTRAALDPLLECIKPVFVVAGNHDDNSYHLDSSSNTNKDLYEECVITDLDWQNMVINRYINRNGVMVSQDDESKRENSKYFYYDLDNKKTRVICLDSIDYEAKYDEDGYVLGDLDGDGLLDGMPVKNSAGTNDSARYHTGNSYWGYSADQVRWLAEDALGTLPTDYDAVFVSHMGMDKSTNSYGTTIWFGDDIRNVIKSYSAGEAYTANFTDIWGNPVSVNADFAGKNGKLLSWHLGHTHVELSHYDSEIDMYQICTSSANVSRTSVKTYEALAAGGLNNKALPWRVYSRKYNSEAEACFNVMSVSSSAIYRFTIGAGNNEKLVYPQ